METSQPIVATGQRFLIRALMLVGAYLLWSLLSCSSAFADGPDGTLDAVTTTVAGTSDAARPVDRPVLAKAEKIAATAPTPEVAAPVIATVKKTVAPVTSAVKTPVAPVTDTVTRALMSVTRTGLVTRTVEQNAAPVSDALAPSVAAAAHATLAPFLELLDRTGVVRELAVASMPSGMTTATVALDRFSHRSVAITLADALLPVTATRDLTRVVLQRVATSSQHGPTGLRVATVPFHLPASPAPAIPALSLASATPFALVGLLFLVPSLGGVSPLGARRVFNPVAGPAYPPGTSPG
ncbi:MAG: hypothetical protein H7270_11580 [Dermatophilaceae bacterium]|nr:hypothetical protein [Dermatophilaceae bacterium]